MKVVTRKHSNEIVAISSKASMVANGLAVDGCVLAIGVGPDGKFTEDPYDVFDVTAIPDGMEANKYCYTPADGFRYNSNFRDPNELQQIKDRTELIQLALDELLLGGAY